jgi:hypothetical protein
LDRKFLRPFKLIGQSFQAVTAKPTAISAGVDATASDKLSPGVLADIEFAVLWALETPIINCCCVVGRHAVSCKWRKIKMRK